MIWCRLSGIVKEDWEINFDVIFEDINCDKFNIEFIF